eukprot:1790888-Pyramimonas_sp.AAC.1
MQARGKRGRNSKLGALGPLVSIWFELKSLGSQCSPQIKAKSLWVGHRTMASVAIQQWRESSVTTKGVTWRCVNVASAGEYMPIFKR